MMSGASAAILRQSIRPRGGGAVISLLSINTGVSANCQFRSVCNTFQLFSSSSSSSTSPIQLSSTSVPLPPHGPRTAASLLLGSSHYSPTFIGSTNRAGLTSFDNLQLRPNNGIRLHRWFSDKSSSTATTTNSSNDSEGGSSQHNTWVQFQRSIAVSGFETGQTTKERTLGKKNRGGKMDRKRKEREAEADSLLRGEDVTQVREREDLICVASVVFCNILWGLKRFVEDVRLNKVHLHLHTIDLSRHHHSHICCISLDLCVFAFVKIMDPNVNNHPHMYTHSSKEGNSPPSDTAMKKPNDSSPRPTRPYPHGVGNVAHSTSSAKNVVTSLSVNITLKRNSNVLPRMNGGWRSANVSMIRLKSIVPRRGTFGREMRSIRIGCCSDGRR